MTGHVGIIQSCARGGSDCTVGDTLPRERSVPGTSFLREMVDALSLSVFKGHLDNILTIGFGLWSALNWSGSWTDNPCRSHLAEIVYPVLCSK